MINQHELKALQTRRMEAAANVADMRKRQSELNAELASAEAKLKQLDREIQQRTESAKGLVVSEHAILRYIERVHGINLDDLKEEMLGSDPNKLRLPSGTFPVNGHKIRVKNNVVVTVLTKDDQGN